MQVFHVLNSLTLGLQELVLVSLEVEVRIKVCSQSAFTHSQVVFSLLKILIVCEHHGCFVILGEHAIPKHELLWNRCRIIIEEVHLIETFTVRLSIIDVQLIRVRPILDVMKVTNRLKHEINLGQIRLL